MSSRASGLLCSSNISQLAYSGVRPNGLRGRRRGRVETRATVDRDGFVDGAREPEVQHLGFTVLGAKDVAGLEVRMHHAFGVHVRQRARAITDDWPGFVERNAFLVPLDEVIERLAAHVLHDDEDVRTVAHERVDTHDIRMR